MESVSQSAKQTDRQTDRRTDRRTDRQTDGQTDGRKCSSAISKRDRTVGTARHVSRLNMARTANILRSDQKWLITLQIRTDIHVSKINQNQTARQPVVTIPPTLHTMWFSFAFPGRTGKFERRLSQTPHSTGMPKSSLRFFKHHDGGGVTPHILNLCSVDTEVFSTVRIQPVRQVDQSPASSLEIKDEQINTTTWRA
jgi:hypothetical protein